MRCQRRARSALAGLAGWATAAGRARYRVRQFRRALAPVVHARDRALAAAVLTPAQHAAFARLPAADRRHAAAVLRLLLAAGARDPDLLVAALLHDLGKVAADGRGRARLPHRVAKVLLERYWPAAWARASARPRRGPLRGCYLLHHHPALGAARAARLGASPRACALIAAHQDGPPPPGLEDALRLLRWADDRA
ncbi:MAG TPA: hypothetical protein VFW96_07355 [Thermomicrobiales bacterium]|nr:hypothetical protein [Thermomicrobiales bacterium]